MIYFKQQINQWQVDDSLKPIKGTVIIFSSYSIPHWRILPILQAQAHPSIISDLWGVLCLLQMMIIPMTGTWQSWELGNTCAVLAFGRLRQELQELKASLGYLTRPCLRKQNTWQCTYTIFPRRINERQFGDKCYEFWSLPKASIYLLWSWKWIWGLSNASQVLYHWIMFQGPSLFKTAVFHTETNCWSRFCLVFSWPLHPVQSLALKTKPTITKSEC